MHSSTPKVLHRVAGVPMVSLVGMAARGLTTDTPVIVVSPGNREAVMRELGDGFEYVDQPTPLGTGHALIVGLQSAPPEALNVLLFASFLSPLSSRSDQGSGPDPLPRDAPPGCTRSRAHCVTGRLGTGR